MQFDRGYLSPYFITHIEKMTVDSDNCVVLLHDKKLSSLQPMAPLLEAVFQSGTQLLIIRRRVQAPLRQISRNVGVDGAVMAGHVSDSKDL